MKNDTIYYEIKPAEKLNFGIKELWAYQELFYIFTWRDIKVKYKQTLLGFLWAVLQPFLMTGVFSLFFGYALQVPSDNIPYPLFVYSGLMFWNVFSSGLSSAANSMVIHSTIIKKIYFPRLIIPISSVLVALFDCLMSFIVFIGIVLYYKFYEGVDISLFKMGVLFPVALFFTAIAALGPGCLLAALNVKYRDFRYLIPFMIQVLLFLTPVIYPHSVINIKVIRLIMSLNPITGVVELYRSALIGNSIEWISLGVSGISGIILFFIGLLYFRKTEAYFADIA